MVMISSAEPPEKHVRPAGLSTARLRVVVADLESIAPDLSSAGETKLASWARNLSSELYALLTRSSGEHSVVPPAPPTNPPRNTGV